VVVGEENLQFLLKGGGCGKRRAFTPSVSAASGISLGSDRICVRATPRGNEKTTTEDEEGALFCSTEMTEQGEETYLPSTPA